MRIEFGHQLNTNNGTNFRTISKKCTNTNTYSTRIQDYNKKKKKKKNQGTCNTKGEVDF